VRRVEVAARAVTWNDAGDLVAVCSDDAFFVLKFSREAVTVADPSAVGEEGVEAAFEVQHEVSDKVQGGVWVGDCFVYTNAANRLNYYVGGEVMTLAHLDRRMYVLGYLAKEGRVFLVDKAGTVVSFALSLPVLEYQTAVVRRDFAAANRILPEVPRDQLNAVAKFLEGQGFKEQALAVADDPDLKFDLAVTLGKLDVARSLLVEAGRAAAAAAGGDGGGAGAAPPDHSETQGKWAQLMDLALAVSNLDLAEECATAAGDYGALLLLYAATGDRVGLVRLGRAAEDAGADNVAFMAYQAGGDVDGAARALAGGGQPAEAEVFATVFAGAGAASAAKVAAAAGSAAAGGGGGAAGSAADGGAGGEAPEAAASEESGEEEAAAAAAAGEESGEEEEEEEVEEEEEAEAGEESGEEEGIGKTNGPAEGVA
jgi:coatomer subunit beta'